MRRLLLVSLVLLVAASAPAATMITSAGDAALAGATVLDLDSEPDGTSFLSYSLGAVSVLSNTNTLRIDDD
ncbi:MAG: hypothetical protein CL910_08100 [Deltaproteobacteria bacterium]|jgi:hypothetical protein|nr:hypothetical protein [Deltaproteobacteria bacterium]